VLGVLAGALLLANHASSGNVSSAQSRAELIGALLVCACFYAPELGRRIQEATAGSSSSSKKNSVDMLGGSSQFLVEESYKETKNTNYAWASYAALTNTNAKGVAFFEDTNEGKLMMTVARGSVRTIEDGASASSNSEVLRKLAKGFSYDRLDVKEDGNLYLSKKKLSQIMFYSGTYSDADFVSSEGTAFEKIIFVSPDDDDYSDSIGYVEHDVIKCSENIKAFTEKRDAFDT